MSNEIVKQKTFEEKMKERIKDSIGELMSNEDLSKIVERAVEEIFFEPIIIKGSYCHGDKTEPPFIHSIIKEILTEQVKHETREYIGLHGEEIEKIIKEVVVNGIGNCVIGAFNNNFQNSFINFQQDIIQKIQNSTY